MDTITHGVAGALIGKAFFADWAGRYAGAVEVSEWMSPSLLPNGATSGALAEESFPVQRLSALGAGRFAIFATTIGSILPDSDVMFGWIEGSNLATLELHRGWTHSFVCMPLLALLLAALTRWVARKIGWVAPPLGFLTMAFAAGIASHIVLDLVTSFGTMIWSPISNVRATLDLAFILDFVMSAIVLLPQLAAQVYQPEKRDGSGRRRALEFWGITSGGAVAVWWLARSVGVGFSPWVLAVTTTVFALFFFLPAARGWGFRVGRAGWCRGGVVALVAYLGLCALAHNRALERVEEFAESQGLKVEIMGALPAPPSLRFWTGLVRTPAGVYQSRINLLSSELPAYDFFADSPPNPWIDAAQQLGAVKTYLWFARFPIFRTFEENGRAVVEMSDLRFFAQRRGPTAFTYRVEFDAHGNVMTQKWVRE